MAYKSLIVSGKDLVEWLMDYLVVEDVLEAVHLASLLCQYGYIFPVTDTKTLSVKDDSTLYRFQVRTSLPLFHLVHAFLTD